MARLNRSGKNLNKITSAYQAARTLSRDYRASNETWKCFGLISFPLVFFEKKSNRVYLSLSVGVFSHHVKIKIVLSLVEPVKRKWKTKKSFLLQQFEVTGPPCNHRERKERNISGGWASSSLLVVTFERRLALALGERRVRTRCPSTTPRSQTLANFENSVIKFVSFSTVRTRRSHTHTHILQRRKWAWRRRERKKETTKDIKKKSRQEKEEEEKNNDCYHFSIPWRGK